MSALITPTESMTKAVAGLKSTHFRSSSYGPDFLEFFANKYMAFRREKDDHQKLNLITGPKADKFYRRFVRYGINEPSSS